MRKLLWLLLPTLASSRDSIIFWQTSPGTFVRIQTGRDAPQSRRSNNLPPLIRFSGETGLTPTPLEERGVDTNISIEGGRNDLSNRIKPEKEENRQKEAKERKVLEHSFLLDKSVGRSGSFLDGLIRRMESGGGKERESKSSGDITEGEGRDVIRNVLEEEEEAVEKETKTVAEEILDLLEQIEGEGKFERKMMEKAKFIIESKLNKKPLGRLIKVRQYN